MRAGLGVAQKRTSSPESNLLLRRDDRKLRQQSEPAEVHLVGARVVADVVGIPRAIGEIRHPLFPGNEVVPDSGPSRS